MSQSHKTTTKTRTATRSKNGSATSTAAAKTRSTSDRRAATKARPKQISLKQISQQRRDLFVCMHEIGCGEISVLKIANGEPILDRRYIRKQQKLAMADVRKPISLNFKLKEPHLVLLKRFEEIENGTLEGVIFEDGRPCRIND